MGMLLVFDSRDKISQEALDVQIYAAVNGDFAFRRIKLRSR
jgi:hypothetical protein